MRTRRAEGGAEKIPAGTGSRVDRRVCSVKSPSRWPSCTPIASFKGPVVLMGVTDPNANKSTVSFCCAPVQSYSLQVKGCEIGPVSLIAREYLS